MAEKAIRPQAGPQEAFLATSADVAIYGGAAGGGKTWGLLLEPLRHIGNKDFGAVIFRRTYPQITQEGAMWSESAKLYPLLGAKPKATTLEWHFPSGSRIRFAHMQYDQTRFDWQGAQIPLIEFDELTHFTKTQFFYMFSRNRSLCGVKPYIRAGTNPDADSWVADLISWWIDEETGQPIKERAGILRWFVRAGDILRWFDAKAEAETAHPDIPPKSLTFIPAKLEDNPALTEADPSYLASLMALPLVDRERLLGGNWKIRPAAGKVFNRAWFEIVDAVPAGGKECRFWDFAATERELKGDDPDYTAGVLMRQVGAEFYIMDCLAMQEGPGKLDDIVKNITLQDAQRAQRDKIPYAVRWEIEPGASGKKEDWRLRTMLNKYDARGIRPQGDKLTRAKPLAAQSEARNVKLLRGAWNDEWLRHMHNVPDGPHDDIMDGSSGAYDDLVNGSREVDYMPSIYN